MGLPAESLAMTITRKQNRRLNPSVAVRRRPVAGTRPSRLSVSHARRHSTSRLHATRRALAAMLGWNGWSRLATLLTALAAVAALWFTAQSLRITRNQAGLAEQAQFTDRFNKALEQLSSDKLDIRMGGVYALERLAHDSERDNSTIMQVLSVFVRTRAPATSCPGNIGPESTKDLFERPEAIAEILAIKPAVDVQSALTVIGRHSTEYGASQHIDLSRTCLFGADLRGANFARADFSLSNMALSDLADASLKGANLYKANLHEANLTGGRLAAADLSLSNLAGADLSNADLTEAKLNYAQLVAADLTGAKLTDADLSSGPDVGTFALILMGYLPRETGDGSVWSTNLIGAHLADTDLTRTKLDGAIFNAADLAASFRDNPFAGVDFTKLLLSEGPPPRLGPR